MTTGLPSLHAMMVPSSGKVFRPVYGPVKRKSMPDAKIKQIPDDDRAADLIPMCQCIHHDMRPRLATVEGKNVGDPYIAVGTGADVREFDFNWIVGRINLASTLVPYAGGLNKPGSELIV